MPQALSVLFAAALIAGFASPALAGDTHCTANRAGELVCPAPDSRCLVNRTGDVVCSAPGGGIELDRYGEPVCGPGYCTKDRRGDLLCSDAPRGAASRDRYGNAACAGSCVPATAAACVVPKPNR